MTGPGGWRSGPRSAAWHCVLCWQEDVLPVRPHADSSLASPRACSRPVGNQDFQTRTLTAQQGHRVTPESIIPVAFLKKSACELPGTDTTAAESRVAESDAHLFSHVPRARGLKSRCRQRWFLLEALREECVPCLSPSFCWLQATLSSLSLCCWGILPVCARRNFSLEGHWSLA